MRDKIRFTEDQELDIVEAHFDGLVLTSPAEAEYWARHVSAMLGDFGRKLWLLIDLEGLIVRPPASAAFGRLRADVLQRHAHASVRYGADPWTRVSIKTSAVVHQTHGNVFATREEALRCLLDLRKGMQPLLDTTR